MLKAIKNIIKSINCPLTKEEKRLLHKLQISELSDRVFTYYKTKLKNNENSTYEEAKAKLIRNFLLGTPTPQLDDKPWRVLRHYGNLSLMWDKNLNEIVWLDNKEGYYPFRADQTKKEWLDRELGINTYKVSKVG